MFLVFFNSFSTSKHFALFELVFWLRFVSLLSKSVFVNKFALFTLSSKTSFANLLNSEVVILFTTHDYDQQLSFQFK